MAPTIFTARAFSVAGAWNKIGNVSALEIAANVFNLLCVYLATLNRVWTWPVGIVGCALYGVMFFQSKLYADVTLQLFFIGTGIYGWRNWLKGGQDGGELRVERVKLSRGLIYAVLGILAAGAYGSLLKWNTDASFPFVDSAVLSFSVIAQFLLMDRKLENWIFWILVNTLSVPLYYSKDLKLTAVIYACFWVNAIYGFFKWRRIYSAGMQS